MAAVDITVVIVNYNVRPFLNHCLQSIFRAGDGLNVEVIVVDNASTDNSAEMVEQNYPDVILLANQENVGFARANNQAFRIAKGEAILILNPDSFVQTDTLRTLFEHLEQTADIGAIGPKILLPDGRFEPRSMRGFPTPWAAFSYLSGLATLFPRSAFFNRYLLTHLDREKQQEVDALSGCCMMVRRNLLNDLQGFDEDYFMFGEDLDLCYRIQKRGRKIIYDPSTRIVHFKGESTRRSDIDRKFHFQKAMRLFVAKNLSGNVSKIANAVINVGFWFQEVERRLLKLLSVIAVPLVDVILLNLFILLGRFLRFEKLGYDLNVWLVNGIYSLFYIISGVIFESHGKYKFSGRKALYTAFAAAFGAAAFTYFFRQWAFSRFVVLLFAGLMAVAMPGWRILFRDLVIKRKLRAGRRLVRRRALIVGTDTLGEQIGKQMQAGHALALEPVGFVDFDESDVGRIIEGIPVLGSTKELDRLIETEDIQELVFSTGEIPYERVIELIQSLQNKRLEFKVIPVQNQDGDAELTFLRLELSSLIRAQKSKR